MLCREPIQIFFALAIGLACSIGLCEPPALSVSAKPCSELFELMVDDSALNQIEAARWLHGQRPLLHTSEAVDQVNEGIAKQAQRRLLHKPAEKISRWLEYVRLGMETPGVREKFREQYLERYVLRSEEVPESHFELQRRVAREAGHGDVTLTNELRDELSRAVVENQRESLGAWWDYLASDDAKQYPAWARVFVLEEVARMGRFDSEKGRFSQRDSNQIASFPELNREALAKVISKMGERSRHREILAKAIAEIKERAERGDSGGLAEVLSEIKEYARQSDQRDLENTISKTEEFVRQGDRSGLAKAISELGKHAQVDRRTFSFSESYGRELKEAIKERGDLSETEGLWVKYPKGSAPEKLSTALSGWNTGWCTTDCGTAGHQLKAGDFYVYYSLDRDGRPRVPRLAIRMEEDRVAEVRGIEKQQNVDPQIAATHVLDRKLKEFGGQGEMYRKRSNDMRRLTSIEAKMESKKELSPSDLSFLYELESSIEGFGYQKDPRIEKILSQQKNKSRENLAAVLSYFMVVRGKKHTGSDADIAATKHMPLIAKGLEAKGMTDAAALSAFGQLKAGLSSSNLRTVAALNEFVSDRKMSGEFRRTLAEAYFDRAKVDTTRLAREVVRHWNDENEGVRLLAREVLALGGDVTNEIPLMNAFHQIENISRQTNVSHLQAAERWLSEPDRNVALKGEYLKAHLASEEFERLESRVHEHQREQVLARVRENSTGLQLRKLAKQKGLSMAQFSKFTPETFEIVRSEFPAHGKEAVLGSPATEANRSGDEAQRAVIFKKLFVTGKTQVPQWLYALVMEENPSKFKDGPESVEVSINGKKIQMRPNHPVEQVNWEEAKEFCKRYTALMKNGIKYDLPLEARTELISRAGTSTRFPFGDSEEELQQGAWYSTNAGGTTHAVAELKPNALGLYDTQGNVWEWQRDWYTEDTSKLPKTDPEGPSSGSYRVIRGGSWYRDARYLRSARRSRHDPGNRYGYLGFRLEGTPE